MNKWDFPSENFLVLSGVEHTHPSTVDSFGTGGQSPLCGIRKTRPNFTMVKAGMTYGR